MGDTEDDARYPPNPYGSNNEEGYSSSHDKKLPVKNDTYSQPSGNQYPDDDVEEDYEDLGNEEDGEEEDNDGGDDQSNGIHNTVKNVGGDADNGDDDDGEDDDDEEDDDDDDDDVDNDKLKSGEVKDEDEDLERHPKKRKLKSLVPSYEFAPRVPVAVAPPPSTSTPSAPKPSFGGRNSLTDWTERETLVLLDAWGDRFLQRGRKSLRFEEWQEVAEKVSEVSKIERTDTQCRNRLDTLKKKYKKEKMKFGETSAAASKWVYFKKMDMLMSPPPQQTGLSCGLDSGEYVFMNPRVYLNRANGLDELRDSPDNSESTDADNDSDGLPPKKRKFGRDNDEGSSVQLLADSIHKFSDIYEKMESSKRKQMVELEKMRMDFHRDLEMQKRQIMERAQAEIAKIRQGDEEENDGPAENASR